MISCLLLTADRRRFVPGAIDRFLRQDYPDRELLILDDGVSPVGDLIPKDERIRYFRLEGRSSVGAKRNSDAGRHAGSTSRTGTTTTGSHPGGSATRSAN